MISMNKYGPCSSRETKQQLAAGTGKGKRNDKWMEKLPLEKGPPGPRVFHEGGGGDLYSQRCSKSQRWGIK